ncbi:hypothetical protein D1AOALGA4SA_4215 [Olavius algarvensis Delta 1 endosymbiont]|nr:hypothetical protein D1AOALGA4SA_4215 [Olavius algarvensis Delta 1 endosymbiont]
MLLVLGSLVKAGSRDGSCSPGERLSIAAEDDSFFITSLFTI